MPKIGVSRNEDVMVHVWTEVDENGGDEWFDAIVDIPEHHLKRLKTIHEMNQKVQRWLVDPTKPFPFNIRNLSKEDYEAEINKELRRQKALGIRLIDSIRFSYSPKRIAMYSI